jgi:ATP-dependent helicase/DNAse subunit B
MKYVIAPKNLHLSLLNVLRKDNPFLDIKLVSKEDLGRYLYVSFKEEAIIYLMKTHQFTYEVSKMYLEDLSYIISDSDNNEKIHFLYLLRNELINNVLAFIPQIGEFNNVSADIIGYSKNDFELKNILDSLKIIPNYLLNQNIDNQRTINLFEKIEDEIYYVLNEIAALIDSGVSTKDIYILRRNKLYDYYLKKLSLEFGYPINLKSDNKLISTGGVKEFLKLYKENKDLDSSLTTLKELMKDDELYNEIEDVINAYKIESSFDIQYDYLVNKFKEKRIRSLCYIDAINVIDNPIYVSKKHIFVLGLAQGQYPRSVKDDKYLNDEELNQIKRLNSKDRTKIDEEVLIDFFNSDNSFIYCFSKRNREGEAYPSPLTKKLDFKDYSPKLADTFYSEKVLKLIYSNLKDLDYFYKEKKEDYFKVRDVIDIDYNSYSNAYTQKANAYDYGSDIYLSTTSLDLYCHCPFHYYLDKVIGLDETESTYQMNLGVLAHHIFEHFREPGFEFDKVFEEKLNEFNLKPSEKYLLENNTKKQILLAVNAIKERERYYSKPTIYNEIKLQHNITKKTVLKGTVDNLVTLDGKYFLCIDYKTGSTKFDDSKMEYGISTQLPTYAYLTNHDSRFKDLTLVGLYINNVLTNSIKNEQKEDELIPSYLKLNGKTLGDLDIASKIDSTIADGKSSFVSGLALKKDGCSLKDNKSIVSTETFNDYCEKVNELYLKMDRDLRQNFFNIKPIFFSDRDNACQYCPYKDVCYVRKDQRNVIKKEEDSDE